MAPNRQAFDRTPLRTLLLGLGLGATLLLAGPATADGGKTRLRTAALPKYAQECAACHIAYPPGFLPTASWQHLMNGLPTHFGTDASLDAASVRDLTAWLGANAANAANATSSPRVREEPPQGRITRSAWFVRKHDEVPAATWKRAAVKSASNCTACHGGAERGDFDEDNVRIPR